MNRTLVPILSALVLCLCLACGDDTEDNSDGDNAGNNDANNASNNDANNDANNAPGGLACGEEPCGGDLIGTWVSAETCTSGDFDLEFPGCPEAESDFSIELTGTVTFNEDGTMRREFTFNNSLTLTVPLSCLGGQGCDVLESDEDEEDAPLECEEVNEACVCSQSATEEESVEETFEVNGNSFTTDPGGEEETTLDFCVKGDEVIVLPPSDDEESPFTGFIFTKE